MVEAMAVEIPRCGNCGEIVHGNRVDDALFDRLREQLGLMRPVQIQAARERLGLSREEVAEKVGVQSSQLADWEDGVALPPRSADKLLRVFFALPEVRAVLVGKQMDPQLGVLS